VPWRVGRKVSLGLPLRMLKDGLKVVPVRVYDKRGIVERAENGLIESEAPSQVLNLYLNVVKHCRMIAPNLRASCVVWRENLFKPPS